MQYARLDTATLGDVTDDYYFGGECTKCKHRCRLSLSKLRAHLGSDFKIVDIRLCALAIGGMVSWAYTWYQPEGRLPIEQVGAKLARFALQMVGVQPAEQPSTAL